MGQDILYYTLSGSIILLTITISYGAYEIVKTVQSLRLFIERTDDIVKDMQFVKEHMKLNILKLFTLRFLKRR